jgi:hypothetical protein
MIYAVIEQRHESLLNLIPTASHYAIKRKFHDIVMRFPFPDPGSPLDYRRICIRLSGIPEEIKKDIN